MKLFLITRLGETDYDEYDSAVVAANSAEEARVMHPRDGGHIKDNEWSSWVSDPEQVEVQCIGTASPGTKKDVICSSFNAG